MADFYELMLKRREQLWKEAENVSKFANKVKRKAFKSFLTEPNKARIRLFGAVSTPQEPPLIFLVKNNITLITLDQLDQAYDETWGDIIAGGGPLRRKWIGIMYEALYDDQLVTLPATVLPQIEAAHLHIGIMCTTAVGASLDNIYPQDQKYIYLGAKFRDCQPY